MPFTLLLRHGRGLLLVLLPLTAMAQAQTAPAPPADAKQKALAAALERASCLIEANSTIKLSSTTQGTLVRMDMKRGDTVKAGQVVAMLDSDVEIAQLAAAKLRSDTDALVSSRKAEYDFNRMRADRTRQLAAKQVVAAQKMEEIDTQAIMARFAFEQARYEQQAAAIEVDRLTAVIERRRIRSPVDGVVARVDLRAGEYADPTVPIAVIAENRPLRVEIYLPAEVYPLVHTGMRLEVRPREPIGGSHVVEVQARDAVIDSASGLFQVQATLANADGAVPAGIRCDAGLGGR